MSPHDLGRSRRGHGRSRGEQLAGLTRRKGLAVPNGPVAADAGQHDLGVLLDGELSALARLFRSRCRCSGAAEPRLRVNALRGAGDGVGMG